MFTRSVLAAAALSALLGPSHAQQTVTVTGAKALPAQPAPEVGGFGEQPLARSPFAATVIDEGRLNDANARQLSDLTKLDASVNDAYDAVGYWSNLAVRGYAVDNRYNFRRDGLPINGQTAINLDNKSRVEVFKGTSGIQAGTSAPGGLVNVVVKRPETRIRSAIVGYDENSGARVAVDLGDRFGERGEFGLRVNAGYEDLDTPFSNTEGKRSIAAAAADWRVTRSTLVEIELESSRQTQASLSGYSMLGNRVPDAKDIDTTLNLNDQAWNEPVQLDGNTASLRVTQQLNDDWSARAHLMTQRLKMDDYTAFPFGCSSEGAFDRYCSDGSFDYYQYVSTGEKRDSDAAQLSLAGRLQTGGVQHGIETGVLWTRYRGRFGDQLFGYAGEGRIDRIVQVPPSADPRYDVANQDERSTELYVRDAMRLGDQWQLWAGLRHTRLERQSEFDPAYDQSATIPWLALSYQITPALMLYGSWGEGLESEVAPNLPIYTNANRALPALKSHQRELGLKYQANGLEGALTLFDIDRPQSADACVSDTECTRTIDGSARHRGIEGSLGWRSGAWTVQASAMYLDAEIEGAKVDTSLNGLRPVNVPKTSLRMNVAYDVAMLPGLRVDATLAHEGSRMVLPDNSATIPSWQRVDLGARWQQRLSSANVTWRFGIDNLLDEEAWKESPYQFSHVYLYPLAPRTVRLTAQIDL